MRVVVPYTRLHPVTKAVLNSYGLPVEYMPLPEPDSYRQLLADLWRRREPVVIVEHDVVPWPGAIEELAACPCAWGSNTYLLHGGYGVHHGFGCTKLTPALMEATPYVWDTSTPWHDLDAHLLFAARDVGFDPHPHRPPVVHLSVRELGVDTFTAPSTEGDHP